MCRIDVAVIHEMIKEIREQKILDRMQKIQKENDYNRKRKDIFD